jgi:hypothetical protein
MKKFLATILLSLPLAAWADMMVMQNQEGGFIALVKDECPIEHDKTIPMFMALASAKGMDIPGCWYFEDMNVHIFWFTPQNGILEYTYSALDFTFVPYEKE